MERSETVLFGNLLKHFRNRAGLTQKSLAYATGQGSRGNIQAWETCRYLPRQREVVLDLARALHLTESETDRLLLAAHYPQEYRTEAQDETRWQEHQVMQTALEKAIQRYATSNLRLELARPLLARQNFLTLPQVRTELAQLVRFERPPDARLIGEYWKKASTHPPQECDFTAEAQRLLDYIQSELRGSEPFRPVFDSKSLDALAEHAASATDTLTHLSDLAQLLATRFSDLSRAFAAAPPTLREHLRDSTRLLQEKTHDFVGRRFVFEAITHFTDTQPQGYYFIRGDPGIGKSALAAQMVRTHGYVHHFNRRSEGINTTQAFLSNICAQLIVAYQLPYSSLPSEATRDAGFLNRLLGEISDRLGPGKKTLLVIDALDEAEPPARSSGTNTLYLPQTLPRGIYMVITTRKRPPDLRIDCAWGTLDIIHDSANNVADIRAYLERAVHRPGLQASLVARHIDDEAFVDLLVEKSEGNFMYLRYILPQIEHGYYAEINPAALPAGLHNYYEDHWRRMRGADETSWFQYKLPILMALTVVKEPVSVDLIAAFSQVRERARIQEVLHEWAQFLHQDLVSVEGQLHRRYHVYHTSFHDFIAAQETVEGERVSRIEAHQKIADDLWSKLLGDE